MWGVGGPAGATQYAVHSLVDNVANGYENPFRLPTPLDIDLPTWRGNSLTSLALRHATAVAGHY